MNSLPLIHQLIYTWAGWPKKDHPSFPNEPDQSFFSSLHKTWKGDGLEVLSRKWSPHRIQFTFRAAPDIAPTFVTARAKGRLDHALRKAGQPTAFSRRVGFRTLGHNTSPVVLNYLARQYDRVDLADPRYIEELQSASWSNPDFDASDPLPTSHGRYWYDVHMVLVTENRFRIGRWIKPQDLSEATQAWGRDLSRSASTSRSGQARPGLKSLAVMHDHVHVVCRGAINRSPADMAGELFRRLNEAAGCRLMQERVYAGSFSEYSVSAIADLRSTPVQTVRSTPTRGVVAGGSSASGAVRPGLHPGKRGGGLS